jgi:hypothetical protein
MKKERHVEESLDDLATEMSSEQKIEKLIKLKNWSRQKTEIKYFDDLNNHVDNLNASLEKERDEILKLMDLAHFWESVYLNIFLQENDNEIHRSMDTAIQFAEKCCENTLENIYKEQSSVSTDTLEFVKEIRQLNHINDNEEIH